METKLGLIKKTAFKEFDNIRKSGKIAIALNEGDELISVDYTSGEDTIMVATNEGKCIRFSEKDVKPLGRDTMGVRAIDLNEKDFVVDMLVYHECNDILTISENGFGKRTEVNEYKVQSRKGKGIKAGIFNEKTGKLVGLKQVCDTDDVMVIADNGVIIRTPASSISKITRDTLGVKVMRLHEGTKVSSIAIADNVAEDITGESGEDPIMVDDNRIEE